jgi:hypothetical protein
MERAPAGRPLRELIRKGVDMTFRSSLVIVVALLAGCQAARVQQPLTKTLGGPDLDDQMEFWHQLEARPITSNDEAFHGLLLYLDGTDPGPDFAHRVAAMKAKGMLPPTFDRPADEAISRGTLAVVLTKAMGIKGGVLMRITGGKVERYAVRELVSMNLYPQSSENQTFNGAEFVGVIGKLEDYQLGNPASVPASVMPGELSAARGAATTRE